MSPVTSSSLPKFLLLLLLLAVPRLGRCENVEQVSEQEDQQQQEQQVISYKDVQQKYIVVWADAPPMAMTGTKGTFTQPVCVCVCVTYACGILTDTNSSRLCENTYHTTYIIKAPLYKCTQSKIIPYQA